VFGDFDVVGIVLFPCEADPVLIIDADALLALSVSLQRLQLVAVLAPE
jgi:hypothetical protein